MTNSKEEKVITEAAAVDIDKALELTGHRWFHWRLLLIGGLAFLGTGFEFTLQGYIQPLAQCDLDLNTAKMSVITAGFIASSVVSSLVWGVMADAVGRKVVLVVGITVEGICTVAASLSPTSNIFVAVRSIGGLLVGAGVTVIVAYVGEFCPDKKRPRNVCLIGLAWTLTWVLMPGMASVIIPLSWQLDLGFVTYKSWRLFIAMVGVINIISGTLIALFLPESPKYYLSREMEKEALEVLQNMYAHNTGNQPYTFPITKLTMGNTNLAANSVKTADKIREPSRSFASLCSDMVSQMQLLMRPPLLWNVFLSSSVYICSMFGYGKFLMTIMQAHTLWNDQQFFCSLQPQDWIFPYYSLGLWLPELFHKFQEFYKNHPNETTSVCEFPSINATQLMISNCDADPIPYALFTSTFILGIACIIGSVVVIYLANKIPAKFIVAIVLEMAAGCCVALYFATAPWLTTLLSAWFLSCVNVAVSTHHSNAINLFPTYVRGMGVCISLIFGRSSSALANLLFGQLIDDYCEIPIFMAAAFAMAGGIFSAILPKSSERALE